MLTLSDSCTWHLFMYTVLVLGCSKVYCLEYDSPCSIALQCHLGTMGLSNSDSQLTAKWLVSTDRLTGLGILLVSGTADWKQLHATRRLTSIYIQILTVGCLFEDDVRCKCKSMCVNQSYPWYTSPSLTDSHQGSQHFDCVLQFAHSHRIIEATYGAEKHLIFCILLWQTETRMSFWWELYRNSKTSKWQHLK